jgi:hypothetical protein
VLATAVITVVMCLGKAADMQMDMPRMPGPMVVEPSSAATIIGLVIHLMMGVAFAAVYVLVFDVLNIDPTWLWGAVFGAVHGVVAGVAMGMGMMPTMHPRMGEGQALPTPSMFGKNFGTMVPAAIIVLHIMYGTMVGAVV